MLSIQNNPRVDPLEKPDEEELSDAQFEPSELQQYEEDTENEIFDDDDFIGDLEGD